LGLSVRRPPSLTTRQARPLVGPPRLVVALLQQPERIAYDFAGGLIQTAADFLVHHLFEFRRQRHVHVVYGARPVDNNNYLYMSEFVITFLATADVQRRGRSRRYLCLQAPSFRVCPTGPASRCETFPSSCHGFLVSRARAARRCT